MVWIGKNSANQKLGPSEPEVFKVGSQSYYHLLILFISIVYKITALEYLPCTDGKISIIIKVESSKDVFCDPAGSKYFPNPRHCFQQVSLLSFRLISYAAVLMFCFIQSLH